MMATSILAGDYKGMRIHTGRMEHLRPTASRIRESIFNLAQALSGVRVLDLYAGSGTLGFEALSRGAESVTFVDHDRKATQIIERNCKLFPGRQVAIFRMDSLTFLNRFDEQFGIIFADPPYGTENLPLLRESAWAHVAHSGFLIIESAIRDGWQDGDATIRRYGDTQISVFEKEKGL